MATGSGDIKHKYYMKQSFATFDFAKLEERFKEIWEGYGKPLENEEQLQTHCKFMTLILFKVGPECRMLHDLKDKVWKFNFIMKETVPGAAKPIKTVLLTNSVYKQKELEKVTDRNMIVLTVEEAELLAIKVLNYINDISPGNSVLSPSALAVFSRADVEALSTELKIPEKDVLKIINSSCQNQGHYLEESKIEVAAIAIIVYTTKMVNIDARHSIIEKKIKEYNSVGKQWNDATFNIYGKYASSSSLRADLLIESFDRIRTAAMKRNSSVNEPIMQLPVQPRSGPSPSSSLGGSPSAGSATVNTNVAQDQVERCYPGVDLGTSDIQID